MIQWKPKKKKCRECKKIFMPTRTIQPVCDTFECKVAYATKSAEKSATERKKRERIDYREAKKKQKGIAEYLKEAQQSFNAWIRVRDLSKGYGCISCGSFESSLWVAGHYRTTKAASNLRFNEDNVHLQCGFNCNVNKSGNIVEYRKELIKRIGVDRVDALENNNEIHRYTKDELTEIKVKYKQLTKELKERNQ
jgi:hypothetical protein